MEGGAPNLVELRDAFGEDEFVGPPPSSMEEFKKLETDSRRTRSSARLRHKHPRATDMAGASALAAGPSSPRVMSPVAYTPNAFSQTGTPGRPKRGRPPSTRRLLQQLEQQTSNQNSPMAAGNQVLSRQLNQQQQQQQQQVNYHLPAQRARVRSSYTSPAPMNQPPPVRPGARPTPMSLIQPPLPQVAHLEHPQHPPPPVHQPSWTSQLPRPMANLNPLVSATAAAVARTHLMPQPLAAPSATSAAAAVPMPAHSATSAHLAQTIASTIAANQRYRRVPNARNIRMPQPTAAHSNSNNIAGPPQNNAPPQQNPLAIPLLINNQMPRNNLPNFPTNAQPVRTAYQDLLRQIGAGLPGELMQNVAANGGFSTGLDLLALQNFANTWGLPSSQPAAPQQHPITNIVNDIINQQTKTLQAVQQTAKRPPTPSEDEMAKQDLDAGADKDEEYHEVETYADYAPQKLKFGQPHPDPVVETSSLSTVEPPDVNYSLALPAKVIEKGLLSALQLETVIYVCQQHQEMFMDGKTRKGFLIGDGAGVGKGRTIAGIIYENFLCGRKKAIWISVSSDLKYDAERDLKDIGAERIPVYFLGKFTYGRRIDVPQGIIFTTYSGLVSKSQTIKGHLGSRLGQLINWVGNDFDGNIVFDECHKAKNISMTKNKKPQSKAAEFALEIQKRLPNARVVYASATGASETKHLGYMTRLGIWGKGTPYESFTDFCTAIEKRGVGAMELVAVDLKMRGAYIARQLSFKTTSFEIKIATLDEAFTKLYDDCVDLWVKAFRYFQDAARYLVDKRRSRTIWSSFWAAHQKFFKYLCIGAKVPLVVAIAEEALMNNKCVVIGLQSTGEAKTLEALDEGDINEFVSTARATFESLLDNHFPVPSSYVRPNQKKPVKQPKSSDSSPGESSGAPSTSGSSTVDESWHGHDAVKFTVENGRVSASIEKDKLEVKGKKTTARQSTNDEFKKRFSKNQQALEDLAKEKRKNKNVSERSLRAKRRTLNDKKKSRIRKPVDDSDTDASNPLSTTSNELPSTSSGSHLNDEDDEGSDETYEDCVSGSEELEDDDEYESTVVGSDSEVSVKAKKKRSSSANGQENDSDSDSDIMYLGAKPKKNNPEVIILSSDGEYETDVDENDPIQANGKHLCDMKNELLDDLEKFSSSLPNNTLDDLINRLGGPSKVAEMTGRKGRVVKDADGQISYKMRNEDDALDNLNIAEKERFMSGQKLVAIISEAASSGISLQADKRVANTRRRVHITIELPWSADRAIQQFGRTHRSNQLSGPQYVFIISELAGEKRFASIVAKRLESLGALTHGDRRATTDSRDLSQFNIASRFCKQALELLSFYLESGQKFANIQPDYPTANFLNDAREAYVGTGLARIQGHRFFPEPIALQVNHFLNRILGMKVRIQNALFKLFSEYMDRLILRKKVQGLYDSGILELNSESGKTRCSDPDNYYLKTKSGTVKCTLHYVRVERGISWEYAMELLDKSTKDSRNGFYISTNPVTKVKMVFLLLRETDTVDAFRAYKPNTGKQPKPIDFTFAAEKAEKSSPRTAERIWRFVYDETNTKCIHQCFFKSCKRIEARMKCDVGLRHRNYCILSGGILTAWPYLERKSPHLITKLQIVRLKLDSRNRVIGPIIPQDTVERVMKILKAGEEGVEF